MTETREPDLLHIYLDDHWAGAGAGLSLARRMRSNNRGTVWDDRLSWLTDQIAADDQALLRLRASLGVKGGRVKRELAKAAERVGRLKPNGRVRSYSPLSRVLEAEALIAGVTGKRRLWAALRHGGLVDHPSLAAFDFTELEERAARQLEVLSEIHEDAAREAFTSRTGD